MAAQFATTEADTAQHFCFITYAHLAQFNSGFKNSRKLFNQLTKVHSAFCCKIENYLAAVESVFNVDNFHIKPKLFNARVFLAQTGIRAERDPNK